MISLEKYGDTTYVDWSKSTPNSLSNGIVIELRWTFIEMRERRNFFRTKYDKLAHFMKSIFIGDEDLDLGIYYEMKDGTNPFPAIQLCCRMPCPNGRFCSHTFAQRTQAIYKES